MSTGNMDIKFSEFILAVCKGRTDEVRTLLRSDINVNGKHRSNGITALMYAAMEGHVDVVRLLIESGADVNQKSESGLTAMDYMLRREGLNDEHKEVISLLTSAMATLAHTSSTTSVNTSRVSESKASSSETAHQSTPSLTQKKWWQIWR